MSTTWNISGLPCDTTPDLRRTLVHLGHWSHANGPLPDPDELDRIDVDSDQFKLAIQSFQQFSGIEPDGVFGDVSHSTMRSRFCGAPDFAPTYDDEAAVTINGTRPFPESCRQHLTVRYRIDELPGMDSDTSISACLAAMRDIEANSNVRLAFSESDSPNIDVYLQSFSGGTLAMARLNAGRCDYTHTLRMDKSGRNWRPKLAQAVFVHELMHNFGYYHSSQRGQIMYPSTNGSPRVLQSEDVERLQAWYGKPTGTPGPTPTPGPAPGGDWTIESQTESRIVLVRSGTGGGGGTPWDIGGDS